MPSLPMLEATAAPEIDIASDRAMGTRVGCLDDLFREADEGQSGEAASSSLSSSGVMPKEII